MKSSRTKSLIDKLTLSLLLSIFGSYAAFAVGFDLSASQNVKPKKHLHALDVSYQSAEKWLLGNFRAKGLFVYRYDPVAGKDPRKNNALRQLMASRLLAELSCEQLSLDDTHQRNLDFIFNHWYRVNDQGLGYIYYNKKSKLGANAMALRTLVYSPFFADYKKQARQLADGIVSLVDESGQFEPWFIKPDYDYDEDYLLTFYSGEAILSLLEYYEKTGQYYYLSAARKAQHWYLIHYVDQLENHYYPAYVPWHTLSLSKLYQFEPNERYAQAVFRLNDELLKILDRTDHIGRFYNPNYPQYGEPHSSSDGVYTESLLYAWEMARNFGDNQREENYAQAVQLALSHLCSLQYKEAEPTFAAPSATYIGALRIAHDDLRIRIDTTQHAMDAFRKYFELNNNQTQSAAQASVTSSLTTNAKEGCA